MPRKPNTNIKGMPFDPAVVRAVWNSGTPIRGYDATQWRYDRFGNVIYFADFGNEQSPYGWHVNHIVPPEQNGFDGLSNLEPLYWKTNLVTTSRYPFDSGIIANAFA